MGELRLVPDEPDSAGELWDEWGRVTRFLESARLAFARERDYWASPDSEHPKKVASPHGRYSATVPRHIDAVGDTELLNGFVLVQSYGLAESAAADRLATDQYSLGGIEEWGARILSSNDRDWTDVEGGLAGAVEVAVMRNAFAHGVRTIDERTRTRLLRAGARAKPLGDVVTLDDGALREFRNRLSSLLNAAGIGRSRDLS